MNTVLSTTVRDGIGILKLLFTRFIELLLNQTQWNKTKYIFSKKYQFKLTFYNVFFVQFLFTLSTAKD